MTRKERALRNAERKERGLPRAKPWAYQKELKLQRLPEILRRHDEQIAAECGVTVEFVQHFRSRHSGTSTAPPPVAQ